MATVAGSETSARELPPVRHQRQERRFCRHGSTEPDGDQPRRSEGQGRCPFS